MFRELIKKALPWLIMNVLNMMMVPGSLALVFLQELLVRIMESWLMVIEPANFR